MKNDLLPANAAHIEPVGFFLALLVAKVLILRRIEACQYPDQWQGCFSHELH